MTDLNLWLLAYDDVALEFGTHDTGYPFTAQVQVGGVQADNGDMPHPLGDGVVPGQDFTRGRTLVFSGAHLSTAPQAATRQWTKPLDDASPLAAAWDARSLRRVDGKVAELTNMDRARTVYGRPRNYAPKLDVVRYGWSEWSGNFDTVDGNFYGPEKSITVTTQAGQVGGIEIPVTLPVTSTSIESTRAWIEQEGDSDTFPSVTFVGPCTFPRIELLDASAGVVWELRAYVILGDGDTYTADCRPWVRTAERDGTPANGLLRGDAMEACAIPPGRFEARFTCDADPSGAAGATLRWRDAFGGL